ncbi:hypothetical protein AB0K21_21665 [Streptosporangium sp. NPDC049248]|uniref:hypothetical protein n=1 Tax=Streptosporangium sp. NPDC049248 TaxID=3155651 RepID=UPI003425C5F3
MIRYVDPIEIAAFATEVGRHLGDTFEARTFSQEGEQGAVVLVNGDERIALLHLTYGERYNNKISFVGLRLDADLSKSTCLSHERGTHTTAVLTRPPKAVANQISRNLLPYYRPQLVSQRNAKAHRDAQRALREAEAARIAALLPGAEHTPTGSDRYYDSEFIKFSGPDGRKTHLSVSSHRGDFDYTLRFGADPAFRRDLIDLLCKHYGTPS